MRTFRLLLLVLLAMLLPLRGALAEVAHCAGEADQGLMLRVQLHDHAAPHGPGASDVAADEAHGHDAAGGHHDHTLGVSDKCNLCSASCSTSPLLNAPPCLVAPTVFATLLYPGLDVAALSFLSDGQDRPPRSL